MKPLVNILLFWPERIASHLPWFGVLVARIVVGYTFLISGLGKLQSLDGVIQFFDSLGIPAPHLMAPVVAWWEFAGGALILLGLFTRISAGGLAVIMAVAILADKWADTHDLYDLVSTPEAAYFAVFTWLAVSGAGCLSLDVLLQRSFKE